MDKLRPWSQQIADGGLGSPGKQQRSQSQPTATGDPGASLHSANLSRNQSSVARATRSFELIGDTAALGQ